MNMKMIRRLETNTLTAPLGLRFQDVVTGEFIGTGLSVVAWPAPNPARRLPLLVNRSSVYVLHAAPGLRDFARRAGAEVWQEPLPRRPFVIEVRDEEERFLPFRLTIELPVRGIYRWADISPAGSAPGIPLYSTVTRLAPPGMAVVRAELYDPAQGRPAAWAVLEARRGGRLLGRGVADELGRVALIFPYPAPRTSPLGSPPSSPLNGVQPLSAQTWSLQLQAFYAPPLTAPMPGSPEQAAAEPPDLQAVLSQRAASLWDDAARTRPAPEAELAYGRALILRSREGNPASPAAPLSVLFITPA